MGIGDDPVKVAQDIEAHIIKKEKPLEYKTGVSSKIRLYSLIFLFSLIRFLVKLFG